MNQQDITEIEDKLLNAEKFKKWRLSEYVYHLIIGKLLDVIKQSRETRHVLCLTHSHCFICGMSQREIIAIDQKIEDHFSVKEGD